MKPQTSSNVVPKRKTKAQRVKELAETIYAQMLFAFQQRSMTSEQKLTKDEIREVFNRASKSSVDAAEVFDNTWLTQKGRFSEEPLD